MELLPDAFNDAAIVTQSHIEAANVPACLTLAEKKATDVAPKAKRGSPPGAKDVRP